MTHETHVMFDLETWGKTPGSDIRSIGAVAWQPATGDIVSQFYVNVPLGDRLGLTRDPETEQWWSEQSHEAQRALMGDEVYLRDGLRAFAIWLAAMEGFAGLWAHGPHFDEAILAAAYRAADMQVPWHYRSPRDMRTILMAAVVAGFELPAMKFSGTAHNALHDAINQAAQVSAAWQYLETRRHP